MCCTKTENVWPATSLFRFHKAGNVILIWVRVLLTTIPYQPEDNVEQATTKKITLVKVVHQELLDAKSALLVITIHLVTTIPPLPVISAKMVIISRKDLLIRLATSARKLTANVAKAKMFAWNAMKGTFWLKILTRPTTVRPLLMDSA